MKRKNRIQAALRRGIARTFVFGPIVFLLVAGAGCPSLFESNTQRATRIKQAVVGKDGAYTIPALPATGTVVNVYATLAATAPDPVALDRTITVNDVNGDFLSAVGQGDLLLIVQMAGATMDTTDTAAAYGTVSTANLGSAGRYEFIGVESKSGSAITLACGLKNGYSRTGKTQVIRVPQYTTLTIGSGRSITARAWDGVTGGVVAVHAETTLQLDGSVDVSAKGFRGGAAPAAKTSAAAGTGILTFRSTAETDGAEKGEGIAGYPPDFATGQYGRGAPANGGGGGDSHNAGGGGGANAGDPAGWTAGLGVMLVDPTVVGGTLAWPLEVTTLANSQGGGRGGYSYSSIGGGTLDPTTTTGRPGLAGWGGDDRRAVGGLGGHPVPNSPAAGLFMGGGGGAGDGNNGVAGPGGRGGGLIFIIAGAVAGSGALHADGAAGGSSTGAAGTAGDAAGGGGGGGTVVVNAASLSATIAITANGGVGGDHTNGINANEVEGPGGGGGGGYIAVSGGTPSLSAAGALGGTTTVATSAMANFRTNGATAGHAGLTNGSASTFIYCGTKTAPVTTIATFPPDHSKNATGAFTFTNTEGSVTYQCSLDGGTTWTTCAASYTTQALADGSHTLSVRSTDLSGNVEDPPVTHTWAIDTVPPVTTIATHPTNPSDSSTGSFTFTNSETPVTYECMIDSGSWTTCTASYTTQPLTDGSHTLSVRSTDQAGNVETGPPYVSFTWVVQANDLSLDGGFLDGGAQEAAPVLLDAEGVDAFAPEDLRSVPDVPANSTPDVAVVVGDDTAPVVSVDAGLDAEGADLLLFLDVGAPRDTKVLDAVTASADVRLADTLPSDAEATPDIAPPAPEPNPDTAAVVVVKEDAAQPTANKDAATEDFKIMGSGFCAIASSRSTTPAPFMVLGLAVLALLRRRRRS
jgi:MYXO-CTERM domain-containing protein